MLDTSSLLRTLGLEAQDQLDPLRASAALLAGMKRHALAVKPIFYLACVRDEDIGRSLSEAGLAVAFRDNIFDAGGRIGWDCIEAAASGRADAAMDQLAARTGRATGFRRRHEVIRMPACDPLYYQALLSQCDPGWIFQAEMAVGAALVPRGPGIV